MGVLKIFCAGTQLSVMPGYNVSNILVNVPHDGLNNNAIAKAKQMFNLVGTQNIFLDSGGYQLYKAEEKNVIPTYDKNLPLRISESKINISPSHVVDVARKINPQYMTSLDFPICKLSDKDAQEREFLHKLGYNVEWAIETSKLKQKYCPHIKLLIPIQAYTIDQLERYVHLIRDVERDGLSMPVRNLNISEIALFLVKFYQMGVRCVHLLGTSTYFNTAIAAFMAKHFFETVSMDATTWREAAQYQKYLNPFNLSHENLAQNVKIDENIIMDCYCPWCQGKTFTDIKNMIYKEKVRLESCHNFYVTEHVAAELFAYPP